MFNKRIIKNTSSNQAPYYVLDVKGIKRWMLIRKEDTCILFAVTLKGKGSFSNTARIDGFKYFIEDRDNVVGPIQDEAVVLLNRIK